MNEVKRHRWAAIYANDSFVCVETCSGFRRSAGDPEGKFLLLDAEPTASALGHALLEALGASRFLVPPEVKTFFRPEAIAQRYEEWVARLMHEFGYTSRRDLFKDMRHCSVECDYETITVAPSIHERLEGWAGIGREHNVLVSSAAPADDLGKAALLALSKCVA